MAVTNSNQRLLFPAREFKVQSPYLYLQTVGSTGADGSTYGTHVRWLLLRNLGDTHLPKGDYATTKVNFNRPGDYVTLLRSRYIKRFPTTVDFAVAPDVVNDALAFWIYTATNTRTVVYIHFRDPARYASVRAAINPSVKPLAFVRQYCPGVIEAEVKDKLFFATEFDVKRGAATVMRAEALSVEANVLLSPLFVSCRKIFTDRNWCPDTRAAIGPGTRTTVTANKKASVEFSADVPSCCDGPNMLTNGDFEASASPGPVFAENFDGVAAPALPAGWVATNALGNGPPWVTSDNPDTAPNSAFAAGSFTVSDKRLDTPSIAIASATAQLSFRNNYNLESSGGMFRSGGVLEVSSPTINGGAFTDITDPAVGSSFIAGGYTGTIDGAANNPLAGRMAWTGDSGGYIDSVVNLGPNVNGLTIKLRFRLGTADGADSRGWYIDTIRVAASGGPIGLGFETDYILQGGAKAGAINVTQDASKINGLWVGLPHTGKQFLTVDGSVKEGSAALRFKREVDLETDYCFTGWLATLWTSDVSIPLQFRFASADGTVQSFYQNTPATVRTWEPFTFTWSSGASRVVTVEIISMSVKSVGNDFGLDDLWFCKGKQKECRARIMSENIRSVRFEVNAGYPRAIEFETYQDYMAGAAWDTLGQLALTTADNTAFNRLEPAPNTVDGHWKKFNDNALLNVANYKDRWSRAGGLKQGVQRYISLSNTDPPANDTLSGDTQPQDGSIKISLLDALRMVSLDFQAARMLGLGFLDRAIQNDTDEFIYLGAYDTEGALDDTNVARPVRNYYMGVPTKPLDYRLPDPPVLKPVSYGLTVDNGESQPSLLTDSQGYTPDGLSRYINLFVEPETDAGGLGPFFVPPFEFCSTDKTSSVFYGVEYRKQGEAAWRKPEIAHDAVYQDRDSPPQFEALPLPNNADSTKPILRHEERENGIHLYAGYGINWFSRASPLGNTVAADATLIKKAQRLLPPSNFAVQLIQRESPLMLTTLSEQNMLAALPGPDRTLLRVTFDYFHVHDINYDFADTVQLFFRSEMPRNVVGAIKSVVDDPSDNHKTIIRTMDYTVNSQGTAISPTLAPTLFGNFVGGVLSCQQENYVITGILSSTQLDEGPIFTVQKNIKASASDPDSTGTFVTVQEYTGPNPALANTQLMFMAVENMADPNSWGAPPNALSKIVTIGNGSWATHQETYVQDGDTITAKLRGIWGMATVTHTPTTAASGVYEIAFDTYKLLHHPQQADTDPVEWYKGAARIARAANPSGPKKALEVLLVKHVGDGQTLVLHVLDNAYDPNDQILTGGQIDVNYYPGYKVYLHADSPHNFTEAAILPAVGEGNRKTWLGTRSRDSMQPCFSPIGIPAPIVGLEFVEPLAPKQPSGSEFATWPDYYYKSSYTFRLNFSANHKPFAVVLYRANDEAILRALYQDTTYEAVRQQLELLGEDDPFRSDRWRDLTSFNYLNGTFGRFPHDGYAFPNPDKGGSLNGSPPGTIIGALQEAIWGAFTALTEQPLIYDFINGPSYVPVPKRQNIRNSQGILLAHNNPEFDMAPMAKRTGTGFEIQFTDFTLDGTGVNIFFYCGREIGNRGRLGDPSPIAGPIQLINARPPAAPGVKNMYIRELDPLANTGPAVNFEINGYPEVQKIGRILIYRATDPADALSIRMMEPVKTVDLAQTNQVGKLSVLLADDFESGLVPYGDPLFYRIVALRYVKNPHGGTDWVPSQPSKVLLTAIPDTVNPEAPVIAFTANGPSGSPATLTDVNLSWPTMAYNSTYYLDKMNAAGNWITVYRIKTKLGPIMVNLAATDLGSDTLPKEDADDGTPVYHRFRVRVKNVSGLFSLVDKVLVI